MKCVACQYEGPAVAIEDSAGKLVYVCPECQTPKTIAPKAWEVLGIPKVRYLAARPWKAVKMQRAAFEAILVHVPPDAVDVLRRGIEAEVLLEAMGFQQDLE
jgi:hypothetical protein